MADKPRLPLPGERPSTFVSPRQRQIAHPWQRTRTGRTAQLLALLPWMIIGLAAYGGFSLWQVTAIPVTLVVNGHPSAVSTHRKTVENVVRAEGYQLDQTLFIDPQPDTPLSDGMVITLAYQRPVIIHADGQTTTITTPLIDPRLIVTEAGIMLGSDDVVHVSRAIQPSSRDIATNPALADIPILPRELEVRRARTIIVEEIFPGEAPRTVSFNTTQPTIGQVLTHAGYTLYQADDVSPPLIEELPATPDPLIITINRATPVTIQADGNTYTIRTRETTVEAALAQVHIALTNLDYAIPSPQTTLEPHDTIQVVRVREETLIEHQAIPFETIYIPDPDMLLDERREVQPGTEGQLERRTRVRRENGAVVSSIPAGEWLTVQPQTQIVAYGTRIEIKELVTSGGIVLHYWRKLRVLATSYSPNNAGHKQPGDPFYGLSGTGVPMQRGIIATDPNTIPLYTYMYVPGYGTGRALDVGGAVKGMRIDLGYDDENLVLWNNWVDVYLLTPVPPYDRIIWVLPD